MSRFSPGSKMPPIKVVAKQIFVVDAAAVNSSGSASALLFVPSSRIHYALDVAHFDDTNFSLLGSTWNFIPCAGHYPTGSGGSPGPAFNLTRLQKIISAGTLPDGYEGESLTQVFAADLTIVTTAVTGGSGQGAIWVVAQFEPARGTNMSDEEWAYWANQCDLLAPGTPAHLLAAT